MKVSHLTAFVSLLICAGCAAKNPAPLNRAGSEDFDRLKTLTGKWETTPPRGEKKEVVTYRVVSAGTAVEETIFAGMPYEMVSLYYLVDGNLEMVHYCSMGNQPRLIGAQTEDGVNFTFAGGTNIDPGHGHYIDGLKLSFLGEDRLRHEWHSKNDGEPGEAKILELKRVSTKPPPV